MNAAVGRLGYRSVRGARRLSEGARHPGHPLRVRGAGRGAHGPLWESDFLEAGVDPVGQLLFFRSDPQFFPVLAPASNQAPICARSASVMLVRFASGMAFSCTVCW